jgi:hypothetical protein
MDPHTCGSKIKRLASSRLSMAHFLGYRIIPLDSIFRTKSHEKVGTHIQVEVKRKLRNRNPVDLETITKLMVTKLIPYTSTECNSCFCLIGASLHFHLMLHCYCLAFNLCNYQRKFLNMH